MYVHTGASRCMKPEINSLTSPKECLLSGKKQACGFAYASTHPCPAQPLGFLATRALQP